MRVKVNKDTKMRQTSEELQIGDFVQHKLWRLNGVVCHDVSIGKYIVAPTLMNHGHAVYRSLDGWKKA